VKPYIVDEPPLDPASGDQILLVLSHDERNGDAVTGRYQLWRAGTPTSAPIPVRGTAPIFGGRERNWTRAEFFAFEQIIKN